jgi:hypothetical protein
VIVGHGVLEDGNGRPTVSLGLPETFYTTPFVAPSSPYRTITTIDLAAIGAADAVIANDLAMNERYAVTFVVNEAGPFQGVMVGFSGDVPYVLASNVSGQAVQEGPNAVPFVDSATTGWSAQVPDDDATLMWLNRTFGKR